MILRVLCTGAEILATELMYRSGFVIVFVLVVCGSVVEKLSLNFLLDKCFVLQWCDWSSGCEMFVFLDSLERERATFVLRSFRRDFRLKRLCFK